MTPAVAAHEALVGRRPDYLRTFLQTGLSIAAPGIGVYPGWRRRLTSQLSTSGLPVLVVWGARDGVLPVAHYEAALRVLPAAGHLFADAGHMPQVEVPSEFVEVVTDFMACTAGGRT
ncbi:hypothetical protein [Mycolicibacterium sp. J2]|uniref:hypothetical protein n=1 Tax=Mycolicibacterium sp. J2 TaxID=2993511 RepID=UPI00224B36DA|nr:hypothetical protein [Mycolicibacterium sp. J2]MCX2715361.1 hypothetical protein [Mycolicibacterium sp. J2]